MFTKNIFVSLSLFLFLSSTVVAQNFVPVGKREWADDGFSLFTVSVQNKTTRAVKKAVPFKVVALGNFKVSTPYPAMPELDPQGFNSCRDFKNSLEEWIGEWKVEPITLKYEGETDSGGFLRPLVEPQRRPIFRCKLKDISLALNQEECVLVVQKLVISVEIPGLDNAIDVEVSKKIPSWVSKKLAFKDETSSANNLVCMDDDKNICKARGHRGTCTLPAIAGVQNCAEVKKITFTHYLPTAENYNDAVFASLFPLTAPIDADDEIWVEEFNEDSFSARSEEPSASIASSLSEGDDLVDQSTSAFTYFEVQGQAEPILVGRNPFMYYAQDKRIYYTQAFQVPAFPIIDGELDKDNPYVLQYFVATNYSSGTHHRQKPGWGLRRDIVDDNGSIILPESCVDRPLDMKVMTTCLKNLSVGTKTLSPVATYIFDAPSGIESVAKGAALKSIFLEDDTNINITATGESDFYVDPVLPDVLSPATTDLELDFNGGSAGNMYKHFGTMSALRHLTIRTIYYFFHSYNYTDKYTRLPPNLNSLALHETRNEHSCNTFGVIKELLQKSSTQHLQKLSLRSDVPQLVDNVFWDIADMVKSLNLDELELNFPEYLDAIWANEPAGLKRTNNASVSLKYISDRDPPSKWETMESGVRDVFGVAMKNSRIKTFRIHLPKRVPRGCHIVQRGGYNNGFATFMRTPTPEHREYTHLITLLNELKALGMDVIITR